MAEYRVHMEREMSRTSWMGVEHGWRITLAPGEFMRAGGRPITPLVNLYMADSDRPLVLRFDGENWSGKRGDEARWYRRTIANWRAVSRESAVKRRRVFDSPEHQAQVYAFRDALRRVKLSLEPHEEDWDA